jgi:HTH-type transcriptional regulator / antitoxin HigA
MNLIMDIRPIKTQNDYQTALKEIERLFDAIPHTPEADLLEIWTTLVEVYENKHVPIPEPDLIDAILYYMESRGLTIEDLKSYLGDNANISNILSRKQPLSIEMIRKLHNELGISADILVQNYKVA